ncbi:MAG: TetR/AcrR family transcriptional regulator [Planctomycetota bacterium]
MPRGRPKEFVREEALAAALGTFWEHGYAATGLADLTESMGIGRQSLYDTFGDKRALFMEALAAYCDRQAEMVGEMLSGDDPPGQRLARFLDSWVELLSSELVHGCMVVNSIGDFAASDDVEMLDAVKGHIARIEGLFARVIQQAIDSGEIDVGLSAREVTRTVMAAADGIVTRARIEDVRPKARDVSRSLKRLLGL